METLARNELIYSFFFFFWIVHENISHRFDVYNKSIHQRPLTDVLQTLKRRRMYTGK